MLDAAAETTGCVERVCALLDRQTSIAALPSLAKALKFELSPRPLSEIVIAFDANVFLRLSKHAKCEDIIDYLRTAFQGRLILPGQVVQEFWNNQFLAVDSISALVRKKFGELGDAIGNIDEKYEGYAERFESLINEFSNDYGYIFDDNTTRRTRIFVELLLERARVPFIPRTLISGSADVRKRSKTPPGFKDSGEGDFYVWADLLLGLAEMRTEGIAFERVVLVTLDKKIDWSREGVPHPILSAELEAICGAEFETITIDTLARRLLE